MPIYETVFMSRQDLSESQVKDLTEKFSKIITDMSGTILKVEQWGLRTLAYKIKKSRKAHYTLIEMEAPSAAVIELGRVLGIEQDVLRSLTTRLEAPTTAQSAILDKSRDRDFEHNTSEKEAA